MKKVGIYRCLFITFSGTLGRHAQRYPTTRHAHTHTHKQTTLQLFTQNKPGINAVSIGRRIN